MQTYDVCVAINGDILHKSNKYGVSAPEVMVLARLHGDANVQLVKISGKMKDWTQGGIRDYLAGKYSNGFEWPGERLVRDVFGPDHVPLPEQIARFHTEKPKAQTRGKKSEPKTADALTPNASEGANAAADLETEFA